MRSRNIKPGFYKNEDLAECSVYARLIFPGLWMIADREGRLEDRPRRIKGELLPFDSVDVDPLLQELADHGLIVRYEMDGARYIQIPGFIKHQSPHYSEKSSVIKPPALPEYSEKEGTIKRGAQPPDSLNPDSLNQNILPADAGGVPVPSSEKRAKPQKVPPCPYWEIVKIYHEELPDLPQVKKLTKQREKYLLYTWREETKHQNLSWWRKYFQVVRSSDFLIGKTGGTWKADFEWLIKPDNLARVIEKRYINRQGGNSL